MRRVLSHQLRQCVVLAIASLFASCSDQTSPTQAPTTIFRTPTGLVTANPPEIILTAGDISDCGNNNDEATAQILDANPVFPVYILGDNVYENGTTSEFNNCYNPTWGRHKARTFASAGNHEYNTSGATPYYNYFGAAAGPAGLGYFSYEQGAWHIIVLNTNISMGSSSAQGQWLAADLAAHPNLCSLAYFHHPLYSSTGGSGSGGVTYSGVRPLYDQLYAAGVDVILAGHRHFYERMAKMKPDGTADDVRGFREFIVGTGGKSGGSVSNSHPRTEVANGTTFGVMRMHLYDDSYAWKFLPVAGKTFSDSGSTACHTTTGGGGSGVSATLSTVSADPTSITAVSGTSTITVTVRDASGNPVNGAAVVLSATGTGNTITQPAGTTNPSGVATGSISSSVAEQKTVTATANGTVITPTAVVTVTTGPVSASQSTVSASPTSIVAGGGPSTITVTAKDAGGNPISGATVVLAATGTGNTLTQPSGPTNASGVATGSLSSTDAETKTVSATINGTAITQTAAVGVTPPGSGGAITHALLTSGNNAANQNVYTTASITPAPNALITVAVLNRRSGGPLTPTLTGGGVTSWTQVGSVDFNTIGVPLSRLTVFRAMSGAPGSGPITITYSSGVSNAQWIVSQWTGVETGGTNGSDAIGQIASNRSDASAGLAVALGAFANSSNVAYGVVGLSGSGLAVSPGSGFSEIAEVASGESSLLEAEWAVNDNTVDATWPAGLKAGLLAIEIKASGVGGGGVSASQSTVAASPSPVAAGVTSTITVTARDASGNPVSGASVVLSATGAGNNLTPPAGLTDESGVATGSLSSTVPGTKVVSATINGVLINQTANVVVEPGAPAALAFIVQPSNATAGATIAPPVQVEIRDAFANRVTGASNAVTMAIGANPSGGTLSGTTPQLAAGGVATFADLSINNAGTGYRLTASAAGLADATSNAFNITSVPTVSAALSSVTAFPGTITVGSGISTITVNVRDGAGNPMSGIPVSLSATGSGNSITQPGATNASGVTTGTLSSTVEETKTVTATADGTVITQTASVTVTPASPGGTITHTLLTSGHDANNLRVYTTGSISPAPNGLVTVAVLTHQSSAAAPSPTLTGGGMGAWDIVATVAYNGATPLDRLTIYRAMSPTPGSGPITITSSVTVSNCQWIVSQWSGVETSGANGTGAVVQTGSTSGTTVNGLTVPLAPFASANHVAYGAFGVASGTAVVTAGSGFTTIDQQPSGESTVGNLFAEWAVNLNPINATWTSKSAGALGIEIKAATGP
ncbi:MAG: Ig-like domain-containing protein [Gemmatimonadales bacterium]